MEKYYFRCPDKDSEPHKADWKPLWRQLLICSGVWTTYFTVGLCVGAPTVFIPQIRKEANSTDVISDDMASWLSSVTSYAGIPWVFVLPGLTQLIGRKYTFILVCISSLIGFIVFYISKSPMEILISEIIQGIILSCHNTISPILVTEYTSPKYRGIFLTIKSATFYWGIWAANAMGTYFHWKNIGLLAFACTAYTLTVFAWPESPYWLASKGYFDKCSASHHWLKGTSDESNTELQELIKSHRNYINNEVENKKTPLKLKLKRSFSTISSPEFYKPVILCVLVAAQYHLSGKLASSIYVIDIIKKITDSESTAYKGMLILDGVTLLGMYFGCVISRFLKRRTLLFSSTSLAIIFLFTISIYLYLIKFSIILENKYVSIALLMLFSITISCGPMILASSIYGELVPSKFRGLSIFIFGVSADALMGTELKVSPYIFRTFGLHGAFLFYGVASSICTFILWKYLPETKDKTIQEIELYFQPSQDNTSAPTSSFR